MTDRPSTEPFRSTSGEVGVLFVHGFTGSPVSLRSWAERTAEAGYRVSLPRLPGHGTDVRELAVTGWEDWYSCVDRELTALREHCPTVFVAGLSMGGALALMLAERRSEDVAGLVLVNPAVSTKNPLVPLSGLLKHVVGSVGAIANDAVLEIDEGGYDRTPIAGVHEMTKLWAQLRPYLDLVTCPLLLFRSTVDHIVPASSADIIRRSVSSLDLEVRDLENSYHVATMDNDADRIVAESLVFFAEHTAAAR